MHSGLRETRGLPAALGPMLPAIVVRVAALHVAPGRRDELLEVIHGNGIRRHRQRAANVHPVQRFVECRGVALAGRRTLLETAGGQHRHGRTRRAVVNHGARARQCRHRSRRRRRYGRRCLMAEGPGDGGERAHGDAPPSNAACDRSGYTASARSGRRAASVPMARPPLGIFRAAVGVPRPPPARGAPLALLASIARVAPFALVAPTAPVPVSRLALLARIAAGSFAPRAARALASNSASFPHRGVAHRLAIPPRAESRHRPPLAPCRAAHFEWRAAT